jgi:hypothetical protein
LGRARFAQELKEPAFAARDALRERDARTHAREILQMTPEKFSRAFKGSPMKRAKLRGLEHHIARQGIESKHRLGRHRWGGGAHVRLAGSVPAPSRSLRAAGGDTSRLPTPRLRPHLLELPPVVVKPPFRVVFHKCGA